MSTHVLDKQIDQALRDVSMPYCMTHLVCKSALTVGWSRFLCLCHLLLTLVYLGAETC